nr:unnamed protein product [Digitaria exilis]
MPRWLPGMRGSSTLHARRPLAARRSAAAHAQTAARRRKRSWPRAGGRWPRAAAQLATRRSPLAGRRRPLAASSTDGGGCWRRREIQSSSVWLTGRLTGRLG